MSKSVIDSFRGERGFLSNFYFSPMRYWSSIDQVTIYGDSVEHIFQAMKTVDNDEREAILAASTPGQAKKLGRRATLRPNWEEIKFLVMLELIREKFKDPSLGVSLLETRPHVLIEGNNWGDTYWGVCEGKGDNNLGKILMTVRAEIALSQRKE